MKRRVLCCTTLCIGYSLIDWKKYHQESFPPQQPPFNLFQFFRESVKKLKMSEARRDARITYHVLKTVFKKVLTEVHTTHCWNFISAIANHNIAFKDNNIRIQSTAATS
jgi:hypothetical protein